MSRPASSSPVLQALDALQAGERRRAVELLANHLAKGPRAGDGWQKVSRLLLHIGEIDLGIEAARRTAMTEPVTLDRLLAYWGTLSSFGRSVQAVSEAERLPAAARAHPAVEHFLGTIASEQGDFDRAERHFRKALAANDSAPQTWFALAMNKTFMPGDPDLAAMERLRRDIHRADPLTRARFHYGMGKARDDLGETDRAFDEYAIGANIRRAERTFDGAKNRTFAEGLIRDFTPEGMARLTPSGFDGQRAIFVNGLPRSGTTLVEQILVSHSRMSDGGEVNLLRAALIPTIDYSMARALAYQSRNDALTDPWGEIARDYHKMLAMRFPEPGLVVDKTLNQSTMMGLLLHIMPDARVIWMRRNPEDVALSCYRSFFTSPIPWSWSLRDIGEQFRIEDMLFKHWLEHFPDRILVVRYEELAQSPSDWIPKILAHVGLDVEAGVYDFHNTSRGVRTASVRQVRQPISTSRIGLAERYAKQLKPFREAYRA